MGFAVSLGGLAVALYYCSIDTHTHTAMDDRVPDLANVDSEDVTTHQTVPALAATDSTPSATATTVAQGQIGAAEVFVWPPGTDASRGFIQSALGGTNETDHSNAGQLISATGGGGGAGAAQQLVLTRGAYTEPMTTQVAMNPAVAGVSPAFVGTSGAASVTQMSSAGGSGGYQAALTDELQRAARPGAVGAQPLAQGSGSAVQQQLLAHAPDPASASPADAVGITRASQMADPSTAQLIARCEYAFDNLMTFDPDVNLNYYRENFCLIRGVVYRVIRFPDNTISHTAVVVPGPQRQAVLEYVHMATGFVGAHRLAERTRELFWWANNVDVDFKTFIERLAQCQAAAGSTPVERPIIQEDESEGHDDDGDEEDPSLLRRAASSVGSVLGSAASATMQTSSRQICY